MKRLFVFVPAIFLVLFLLNSFVSREGDAREKTAGETNSLTAVGADENSMKAEPAGIVLKSIDNGQTWQAIGEGLPEIKPAMDVVESGRVRLATGQKGIMRSTDRGEHWQWVISEGGVGIAVETIQGGFAAITYNTETKSRRIRISMDSGKSWQVIDGGLRPSSSISSIKQVGTYLIVGHPDGIFRSSDMGKTWNSVHPGVDKLDRNNFKFLTTWNQEPEKVLTIYASGNVLYAVAGNAGC